MVGTIQGTTKKAIGAGPGEKQILTYEGPVSDEEQVYTPLTRTIDAVVASPRINQTDNSAVYSTGVYQVYTRSDGSAYDRGSIYFSVYATDNPANTGAVNVSVIAIGESGRSGS